MVFNILIVFFSLIALASLHEFGHFILAKRFGVKVEEFGIGYPPRILGKKIGETIYSLNLLPFGAFVKIYGEEGPTLGIEDYRSFTGKPIWQRAIICLGGIISFWIIGVILLSIVFGIGATQAISDTANHNLRDPRVQVVAVAGDSPAQIRGIKIGDTICELKIKNEKLKVDKVKEIQEFVDLHRGEALTLTIKRGKEVFDLTLVPRVSPPEGEGAMGVGLVRTAVVSFPFYLAPIKGITATFELTGAIFRGLCQLFGSLVRGRGLPPGVELMGPVGIGSLMVQAAQIGLVHYLQFIATISIYLALFNALPIPALDGGKLLFLGIEKIKGSPINQKIEQNVNLFFFSLIILLMIFVTIKDITRLF